MKKAWRLIVAVASVLYIILLIKKVDMTRSTYVILMGIVFMNQAVEEWDRYVETNKKNSFVYTYSDSRDYNLFDSPIAIKIHIS